MDIRTLRIAMFTGNYNAVTDGVSLTLNRLVKYLIEQGAHVHVYAPTIALPAIEHAGTLVPVTSISAPGRPEYRVSLGLSSTARRDLTQFSANLFHIATPDLLGLAALRMARKMDIPVIATYHTHFASYLDYYRLGALEGGVWRYLRWFYAQCKEVFVPSESMIGVLEKHGIRGNLVVWPRGVDSHAFSPSRRSSSWRKSRGIADEDVVVAFVSRLVTEKGLDVVTDVHRKLTSRGIAHRMLFVGDGPEKPKLQSMNPDALFEGHLSGEDLAAAYASSDIFLFPSETETFGNVTLEAMTSGLPVVVANATGSSSLVRDGVTGFLCEPRNADSFAAKVELLIRDSSLRSRLGTAARNEAARYDWSLVLEEMSRNYERVTT